MNSPTTIYPTSFNRYNKGVNTKGRIQINPAFCLNHVMNAIE